MNRSPVSPWTRRAVRATGFTLIELMIAVAIVALLAAVALPSYQDSVWKGKRGEAKAAIMKAMQAEERYYTQNNTYIGYSTSTAPPSGAFPVYSADTSTTSRYSLAAAACGGSTLAQCVLVTATVLGGPDPICGTTLSLDSAGNKTPVLSGPTLACWK